MGLKGSGGEEIREAGRKEGFPEVGCVLALGDWTS